MSAGTVGPATTSVTPGGSGSPTSPTSPTRPTSATGPLTTAGTADPPVALTVPDVRVRVDGASLEAVHGAHTVHVAQVRVRREASTPAACTLTLTASVVGALDDVAAALTVGADVTVALGPWPDPLFRGDLLTVEDRFGADGSRVLVLRCQDRAHRWRQATRIRVITDVTVADVVTEVAGQVGLDVTADETGPRWPHVLQDGRSTLDLVTSLTARAGLWWQVEPDGERVRLRALTPGAAGDPVATVAPGRGLVEAVVRRTAAAVHDRWRVTGWDPVTGDVVDGSGSTPHLDLDAVGRVEADPGVRAGTTTAGPDHADAAATALAGRDAARARVLHAVVLGDPALVPGATLRVEGLGGSDGDHVLLTTDHVVDPATGYTCVVSSAPPGSDVGHEPLDRTAPSWAAPADVVDVDDPERRGRVRVSLLTYDGAESAWLPVLAVGGGGAKGLTCQPDVGDRVLLLHDPDDPGRGVVLGGVRSDGGPEPAAGVVDGAVGTYALGLPGGQVVRVAADGDRVVLENHAGSRVELSADGVVVHAAGDLTLEAPGRRLRLRADRIDLERG